MALLAGAGWLGARPAEAAGAKKPLPLVILLGDSIRMSYQNVVRAELAGKAEVWAPKENCSHSAFTAARLDRWLRGRPAAVVHINVGLHDLFLNAKTGKPRHSLDVYARNLRIIFQKLQQLAEAKILFALTTPVVEARQAASKSYGRVVRRNPDIVAYNSKASEIAKEFGVDVNDVHATVMASGVDTMITGDGVHLSPKGRQVVGKQVAQAVLSALQVKTKP